MKKPKRSVFFRDTLEPWQDPEATPYVAVNGLTKRYRDGVAVSNMSLSIYRNEFFSLLGGSGSGKSTLLRMIAGLEQPTEGSIFIDGVDMTHVPAYDRPVNMMFQSYALFPHMTVEQNIAFGLRQERFTRAEIQHKVDEVLDLVHLPGYHRRVPDELSGGQQQRVALARCLVKKPKVLLLDEPLAALDKKLRDSTQFELVTLQESLGMTFIMVTHDQEEAMTVSSRIGIMDAGAIRQIGTPHEIYEFPNSRFVADFIGLINILEGIVTTDASDHVIISAPSIDGDLMISHAGSVPLGASVAVAIRPEKILLAHEPVRKAENHARGVIKDIGYLGDISIYHVQLDSGQVLMATQPNLRRQSESPFQWDDQVYLHWDADSGVVLTA